MLSFVAVKYVSLALSAARSFVLAAVLGPASFGVLGTLIIIQQYLSYTALGVREGLAVRLAQGGDFPPGVLRSSALAWGAGVGILIVITIFAFDKTITSLSPPWTWVGLISLLSICNEMLINMHRDLGKLMKVALLEVAYNLIPLACVLLVGESISIVIVLQSLAFALSLNIIFYVMGLPGLHWRNVKAQAIQHLVSVGIPLAISAFFAASVTSVYVILASAMNLGEIVGLIVFANSICTIILYGSNMVAWAATSRSMRQLAATSTVTDGAIRNQRLTYFFRAAVLVSVLAVTLSGPVVERVLPAYAGMELYASLFCLLQSFSLLLYIELNFMAVTGRSAVIAASFGFILAITLLIYLIFPRLAIAHLVTIAIGVSTLVGLACVHYCHRAGLRSASLRSQMLFVFFPLASAATLYALGSMGVAFVTAGFLMPTLLSSRLVFRQKLAN